MRTSTDFIESTIYVINIGQKIDDYHRTWRQI